MKISMFPGNMARNDYVTLVRQGLAESGVEAADFRLLRDGLMGREIAAVHVQMLEVLFHRRPYRYVDELALGWLKIFTRGMERLRARGGHFVWTAHNVVPHDRLTDRFPKAWRHWREETTPLVDRVVALSADSIPQVQAAWPSLAQARFDVIPHPHYRSIYTSRRPRAEQRRQLGLPEDALVLGSIGTVRPYKGLIELIEIARRVLLPEHRLLIAGHCYDEVLDGQIRAAIGGDERIVYAPKPLENDEYASILGCVDINVLNYRNILNSGSVFASLSLDVPVIAPNLGSIAALAREIGPPWVRVFDDTVEEPIRALIHEGALSPGASVDLSAYDPARVGALHAQTYR
ncbi:glycosyltransferase [Aureimonas sp. AU20]|uniref:glycosyltransferase n=1 Tax=Aureimonas sp. AU20 TaxID=1349819 RepID=UPI0007844A40|nr:glycosyltransferase [Aureimonas sp. AU20]